MRTPNVEARPIAPEDEAGLATLGNQFDSALCLHALEGAGSPAAIIHGLAGTLKPDGRLIIVAPESPALFGTVDRAMGQLRRFRLAELTQLLTEGGFRLEHVYQLNKAAAQIWWLNSRVLGSQRISKMSLKLFDKLVWLWRILDHLLPWKGLTLLVTARRK